MDWGRVSTKTLITIGSIIVCGSAGGMAFLAFHEHHAFSLSMSGVVWGAIWLLDSIRCSLSLKSLQVGDESTAKRHLGKVVMLRSKATAIRNKYGLG